MSSEGFHSIRSTPIGATAPRGASSSGTSAVAQLRSRKAEAVEISNRNNERVVMTTAVGLFLASVVWVSIPFIQNYQAERDTARAEKAAAAQENRRLTLASDAFQNAERDANARRSRRLVMSQMQNGSDINDFGTSDMNLKLALVAGTSYGMQQERRSLVERKLETCGGEPAEVRKAYLERTAPVVAEMEAYQARALILSLQTAQAEPGAPSQLERARNLDPDDPVAIAGFVASGGVGKLRREMGGSVSNQMAMFGMMGLALKDPEAGNRPKPAPRKTDPEICELLAANITAGRFELSLDPS